MNRNYRLGFYCWKRFSSSVVFLEIVVKIAELSSAFYEKISCWKLILKAQQNN
jgi:hypothetical protein